MKTSSFSGRARSRRRPGRPLPRRYSSRCNWHAPDRREGIPLGADGRSGRRVLALTRGRRRTAHPPARGRSGSDRAATSDSSSVPPASGRPSSFRSPPPAMFPISASRDSSSPRIASFSPYCVPGGRAACSAWIPRDSSGWNRAPAAGRWRMPSAQVSSAGRGHPGILGRRGRVWKRPPAPTIPRRRNGRRLRATRAARAAGTPWRIPAPVPGIEEFEEAAAGRASRLVPRLAPAAPRAIHAAARRRPRRGCQPRSPQSAGPATRATSAASWRRPISSCKDRTGRPAGNWKAGSSANSHRSVPKGGRCGRPGRAPWRHRPRGRRRRVLAERRGGSPVPRPGWLEKRLEAERRRQVHRSIGRARPLAFRARPSRRRPRCRRVYRLGGPPTPPAAFTGALQRILRLLDQHFEEILVRRRGWLAWRRPHLASDVRAGRQRDRVLDRLADRGRDSISTNRPSSASTAPRRPISSRPPGSIRPRARTGPGVDTRQGESAACGRLGLDAETEATVPMPR